jgi:hypothetical protein
LVDPLTAIQSGQLHLQSQLAALDQEQLRDVMADYRMDPSKLAMKWKDRDRVIEHIVATAVERGQKGDAFRARLTGGAATRRIRRSSGAGIVGAFIDKTSSKNYI